MPLLREFKALTQSAGASLFAYPCELTNMDGTLFSNVTAVPLYFQIFDKASAPVANDIPIKSFVILTGGPFPLVSVFQNMGPVEFALGFAVGISSAHEKYTAATAVYDVFGEIIEGFQQTDGVAGLSAIGDTTTHVDSLAVWADGDNSNLDRLMRIYVSNLSGAIRYLMLFSSKTGSAHPNNGDYPIRQWKLGIGVTTNLYFGRSGLIPTQTFMTDDGSAPAKIPQYGCALICSSTTGVLLATGDSSLILKAWYSTT